MADAYLIGIGFAAMALVMFSANVIITRLAISRASLDVGFGIAVLVNVAFGALACALVLVLRSGRLEWDARAAATFLLSGAFTTYLGRWFLFESVARLGAARASVFQVSSPLFTALVAWLFLGERLSAPVVAAMAVVVVGLYLVSVTRSPSSSAPAPAPRNGRRRSALMSALRSGLLLGIGSSLAYAIGNVLRGAAIHRWQEPVIGALLGAIAGAALHSGSVDARVACA